MDMELVHCEICAIGIWHPLIIGLLLWRVDSISWLCPTTLMFASLRQSYPGRVPAVGRIARDGIHGSHSTDWCGTNNRLPDPNAHMTFINNMIYHRIPYKRLASYQKMPTLQRAFIFRCRIYIWWQSARVSELSDGVTTHGLAPDVK